MKVRARLFAQMREIAGREELELDISAPTVGAAFEALVERIPELGRFQGAVSYAVQNEYVPADSVLEEGSEVVFIPPISGG